MLRRGRRREWRGTGYVADVIRLLRHFRLLHETLLILSALTVLRKVREGREGIKNMIL